MVDWKRTGKKMLVSFVGVVIAGCASVYANNPYWLMIAPLITGIYDTWKHWGD